MAPSDSTPGDYWFAWPDLALLGAFFLAAVGFVAPGLWPDVPSVLGHPFSDVAREFFGSRAFAAGSLADGVFPFWNPYSFGGTPYFANPGAALFYPPNALFLLLPVWQAINVTMALHLGLTAWGAFLFGRTLGMGRLSAALAGLAFGGSAHVVLNVFAGHLTKLCTFPWIPLSFAALERTIAGRRRALAAVALAWTVALMVLAGHTQYAVFALVGMAIYGALRLAQTADGRGESLRTVGALVASGALAAALVAVQVVPTLELLDLSVRQSLDFSSWVGLFRLPPENLATFFLPDFFGNVIGSYYWGRFFLWETCFYVGLAPLGLAALALARRPRGSVAALMVMGASSLVLAFGGAVPGLGSLLATLPVFRSFRGYSKFALLTALALALLAGWGLEAFMDGLSRKTPRRASLTRWTGLVLLGLAGAVAVGLSLWSTVPAESWEALLRWANVPGETVLVLPPKLDRAFVEKTYEVARLGAVRTFVVVAACGGLLALSSLPRLKAPLMGGLAVFLVAADLAAFGLPFGRVVTPIEQITFETPVVAYLTERLGVGRIMLVADELLNRSLAHRIPFFGGKDVIIPENTSAYFNRAQELPIDTASLALAPRNLNRLADLYAVAYILRPRGRRLIHPRLVRVFAGRRHAVYRNLSALPRAVISSRLETLDSREAVLNKLAHPRYDPQVVLYTTDGELPAGFQPLKPGGSSLAGMAEITEENPNRVVVVASLEGDGYLYLADPAYPGWRVEVDGRPDRWFAANVCCRAVALKAGRHRVVFTFRPLGFKALAALALMASLAAALAGLGFLRRRRKVH